MKTFSNTKLTAFFKGRILFLGLILMQCSSNTRLQGYKLIRLYLKSQIITIFFYLVQTTFQTTTEGQASLLLLTATTLWTTTTTATTWIITIVSAAFLTTIAHSSQITRICLPRQIRLTFLDRSRQIKTKAITAIAVISQITFSTTT